MKNITIIIPHFNSVELLRKLLISIPHKEAIEVIVVDDKSTVCKEEYKQLKAKKYFEHIIFMENKTDKKGAGACRNIGLKNASGQWVLFADADDYFTANMYESASRYFSSSSDVIYFTPTSVYINTGKEATRHKRFARKIEKYLKTNALAETLELKYKFEVPWSKMIKRSLIVENKISFEEVIVSNDVLFSAKVGFHIKQFDVSTDIIYVVTKGLNSLTTDMSDKMFFIRFKEKEKYYRYLKAQITKKELAILKISFLVFLLRSRKYGVKKFIAFLNILIQHKLHIINRRVLNPIFLFRAIKEKRKV